MNENELRPCPLCGAMPTVLRGVNVMCSTLGCLLQENTVSVERWNTRPIEDELRARIAELEHDLSNKEIEYTDLWDDALALQDRIAELEAELRWIPVSERLPELDQDVFAIVDGDIDIGHFYESFDGEIYYSSVVLGAMMVATHWLDVPALPEECEE